MVVFHERTKIAKARCDGLTKRVLVVNKNNLQCNQVQKLWEGCVKRVSFFAVTES